MVTFLTGPNNELKPKYLDLYVYLYINIYVYEPANVNMNFFLNWSSAILNDDFF